MLFTAYLLLIQYADFNSRCSHHILRQLIRIRISINNALNACVNQNLGADHTGLMRTINCTTVDRHTMIGSLHYSILLCVNTAAQLMHLPRRHMQLLAQAARNLTVRQILRRTVIACRYNLFILTITAPTLRRIQVERLLTTLAISIK